MEAKEINDADKLQVEEVAAILLSIDETLQVLKSTPKEFIKNMNANAKKDLNDMLKHGYSSKQKLIGHYSGTNPKTTELLGNEIKFITMAINEAIAEIEETPTSVILQMIDAEEEAFFARKQLLMSVRAKIEKITGYKGKYNIEVDIEKDLPTMLKKGSTYKGE